MLVCQQFPILVRTFSRGSHALCFCSILVMPSLERDFLEAHGQQNPLELMDGMVLGEYDVPLLWIFTA